VYQNFFSGCGGKKYSPSLKVNGWSLYRQWRASGKLLFYICKAKHVPCKINPSRCNFLWIKKTTIICYSNCIPHWTSSDDVFLESPDGVYKQPKLFDLLIKSG
jgi:hypothetical protein